MRWGEALGQTRRARLGAAAAFHRRDLRPGDRRAGRRAFDVDGIAAGDTTHGHRFLAPAAIKVRRLDDYVAKLEKAKVVLDPERRAQMILPTPRTSPSRRASNWSRTRACWPRSRAWSNGRSC